MKFIGSLLLSFFMLAAVNDINAQLQKSQAAYIYNFTRFIEWPSNSMQNEFVIGVFGKNHPITSELNASASQRTVGSSKVKVVEFANIDQVSGCHILFVPDERSSNLKKINEKFSNTPMIVITEEQDWTPAEATINFMVVDSKLAFKINQAQFKDKNMKVSDKLVALSK